MKHCTSSPKRVSIDDQENKSTLPLVESAALDVPGNNGVHSDADTPCFSKDRIHSIAT